jgi:SAM-dependent methyltransferase
LHDARCRGLAGREARADHAMTTQDASLDSALAFDCDRRALPSELAARFAPLADDGAARAFAERARAAPHGAAATFAYGLLRRALSDYDAYGWLGMYPMHLLSTAQFADLLAPALQRPRPLRLLDVGAGDGGVTARAAPLFAQVTATEASRPLRRRLRARGFSLLALDLEREPVPDALCFDAVLCLNVLDRCAYPRTLLAHARTALASGGLLLVSIPLPLRPHVQRGGQTVAPEEPLPEPLPTWELGAASIARELLTPCGLAIERLARAPYLSRGDARTPLYALDAALFVCRAA